MKKVNYIVDADIKGFFDNVDHEWLIECIKQRIADPNVIRLSKIKAFKVWLKENRNQDLLYIINMVNLKLRGHFNYFGFYDNFGMINKYRYQIIVNLFKWLNRRSQKKSYTWQEFNEVILTKHPIMKARVCAKLY